MAWPIEEKQPAACRRLFLKKPEVACAMAGGVQAYYRHALPGLLPGDGDAIQFQARAPLRDPENRLVVVEGRHLIQIDLERIPHNPE